MDQQLSDQLTTLIDGAIESYRRPRTRRRGPRSPTCSSTSGSCCSPPTPRRPPRTDAALGPQLERKSRVKTASSSGRSSTSQCAAPSRTASTASGISATSVSACCSGTSPSCAPATTRVGAGRAGQDPQRPHGSRCRGQRGRSRSRARTSRRGATRRERTGLASLTVPAVPAAVPMPLARVYPRRVPCPGSPRPPPDSRSSKPEPRV